MIFFKNLKTQDKMEIGRYFPLTDLFPALRNGLTKSNNSGSC